MCDAYLDFIFITVRSLKSNQIKCWSVVILTVRLLALVLSIMMSIDWTASALKIIVTTATMSARSGGYHMVVKRRCGAFSCEDATDASHSATLARGKMDTKTATQVCTSLAACARYGARAFFREMCDCVRT